jgi:L-threonylcarbamoyladenylate synthase
VILCRNFGEQGLGLAIRDRLLKAAGGKICK